MHESCHTYEGVMSHIWMVHVTHTNTSCHTNEGVTSHEWMSHVTHMMQNKGFIWSSITCHTYERVMSHVWMSHVTRMNESCHTYECVMSHMWISHVQKHLRQKISQTSALQSFYTRNLVASTRLRISAWKGKIAQVHSPMKSQKFELHSHVQTARRRKQTYRRDLWKRPTARDV